MRSRTVATLLLLVLAFAMILIGTATSAAEDYIAIANPVPWDTDGAGTADPKNNCTFVHFGCNDGWSNNVCYQYLGTAQCELAGGNKKIAGMIIHAKRDIGYPMPPVGQLKGTTTYKKIACGVYKCHNGIEAIDLMTWKCDPFTCYKYFYFDINTYCTPITTGL